jgi:hypothetical protein
MHIAIAIIESSPEAAAGNIMRGACIAVSPAETTTSAPATWPISTSVGRRARAKNNPILSDLSKKRLPETAPEINKTKIKRAIRQICPRMEASRSNGKGKQLFPAENEISAPKETIEQANALHAKSSGPLRTGAKNDKLTSRIVKRDLLELFSERVSR